MIQRAAGSKANPHSGTKQYCTFRSARCCQLQACIRTNLRLPGACPYIEIATSPLWCTLSWVALRTAASTFAGEAPVDIVQVRSDLREGGHPLRVLRALILARVLVGVQHDEEYSDRLDIPSFAFSLSSGICVTMS
jgi:hypothetical protein